MSNVISSPYPYLTLKSTIQETANTKMLNDGILQLTGYPNSMEKSDEDQPLDFSRKKSEVNSRYDIKTYNNIHEDSEHHYPLPQNLVKNDDIRVSRNNSPHSSSPPMPLSNLQPYPSQKTILEQMAYAHAFSKYGPIFPKLNVQVPVTETQHDNKYKRVSPIQKRIEHHGMNGLSLSSPLSHNTEYSMPNLFKNTSSPPLEPNLNTLNDTTTFTPSVVLSPPSRIYHESKVSQELLPKTPVRPTLEEISILQRTLTAPLSNSIQEQVNNQRSAKNSKPPRPFKAYNPVSNSFPTGLPTLPLGIIQDFEDQEYRYQQYMERMYSNKSSKSRGDGIKTQESIDRQAGSSGSGEDRRESPSTSDSSPRSQAPNPPIKTFEDSNGSSADIPTSQADTSSPQESRNSKRIRSLPEELKDAAYWERRRKNNEAAKRSRDSRRQKEDFIAMRARFLEDENKNLRLTVAFLRQELSAIKCCAAHNHNRL